MEELVPINILLGDRTYRVKIEPKDEETVRKAVKVINDKITEFKTQFAGKDMQDYIAMVLIWYATSRPELASNNLVSTELQAALKTLENTLDKALAVT
ncbi:MAG TPA: cell division protein ZapA [Chitinophagaceae bacterium]|jgi:cell division protein ZapA|nr:cell division protein ZapA [Chitinophagaceae bacterium]